MPSTNDTLAGHGLHHKSSECQRRYHFNPEAFDHLTETASYWAGFLMGDGSVWHRKTTAICSLSLAAIDRLHVEKFRDFLQSNHPVRDSDISGRNGGLAGRRSRFEIASLYLVQSLERLGVVPGKTHTARAADVLARDRHFWRGVVDADGSLYTASDVRRKPNGKEYPRTRHVVSLAGAKPLMEQFADYVRLAGVASANVLPHKSIFMVRFQGLSAEKLAALLYGDSTVSLDRKYQIWRSWISGESSLSG